MTAAGLPPNVRVIETPQGVSYRFARPGYSPTALILSGVLAAVPVAAGVLAASFLVRHLQELPPTLTALGCLFLAQMAFLAQRPLWFFWHNLWQALVAAAGQSELAVEGRWLVTGSRLGPLRRCSRRPVPELGQLTVYVYLPGSAVTPEGVPPAPPPEESACLAAEFPSGFWPMVDGLPRAEALALAEHLNARLGGAIAEAGMVRQLPSVAVVATTQDALYPGSGEPGFPLRRRLWWLAWHLAGCVGLAALWLAARQTSDWENSRTRLCLFVAGFLEAILVVATIKWPGQPAETPGKK